MSEYYDITEQEMNDFLVERGFQKIEIPGTIELVYGKRVDQDDLQLSLRCYSGINPDGHSRRAGKDAIRLELFMRLPDGTLRALAGTKRVHRVKGWKNNLGHRLATWASRLPKKKCSKCGLPMVPRKTKKGKGEFLGCVGYPECRQTLSINGNEKRKLSNA